MGNRRFGENHDRIVRAGNVKFYASGTRTRPLRLFAVAVVLIGRCARTGIIDRGVRDAGDRDSPGIWIDRILWTGMLN